jgi:hypothetical protein
MENTNLIGRKVKGFKFEHEKYNELTYAREMDEKIGEIGTIVSYNELSNSYCVEFKDDYWYYPASLIEQHLVDESSKLEEIDVDKILEKGIANSRLNKESNPLDNLPIIGEGVLMEVSKNNVEWDKRFVFAKYGKYFLAHDGASELEDINYNITPSVWYYCRPITPKTKITRAEFERQFEIID